MQHLKIFFELVALGLIFTALISPIIIKILYIFSFKVSYKLMKDKSNEEFIKIHGHKVNTPTLGGIMIAIGVLIVSLLFIPDSPQRNIILIGWFIYFIYGLLDGLLVYGRKLSDKMRKLEQSFGWRLAKLILLYLITLGSLNLVINIFNLNQDLNVFGINFEINTLALIIGSFFAVIAIYGMEITDGADGLVTGQFLVSLLAYALIAFITQNYTLLAIIGVSIGSLIVYLYFNINPARVFMGGTGTFPVAFLIVASALITNTIDVLLIMGTIFWAEVTSSTLQILSLKFRKKKLFKIAPIHHYFESIGWPETKMVQRFWLFSIVFMIFSLLYYVTLRAVY